MHEKYMEKAWDGLNASGYLLKGGFYNESASRAYYAMFYAAKAILAVKGIHPRKHSGVVSQFGLQVVKEGLVDEYYGRHLNLAQEIRESADYDLDRKISLEEATDSVNSANDFVAKIESLIKDINHI